MATCNMLNLKGCMLRMMQTALILHVAHRRPSEDRQVPAEEGCRYPHQGEGWLHTDARRMLPRPSKRGQDPAAYVICRMPYVVCRMLCVTCGMRHVVCCTAMPYTACRKPYVANCMLYIVCLMSYVVCRTSYAACHMSYVVHRMSHVACRMLHVVCRLLYSAACRV